MAEQQVPRQPSTPTATHKLTGPELSGDRFARGLPSCEMRLTSKQATGIAKRGGHWHPLLTVVTTCLSRRRTWLPLLESCCCEPHSVQDDACHTQGNLSDMHIRCTGFISLRCAHLPGTTLTRTFPETRGVHAGSPRLMFSFELFRLTSPHMDTSNCSLLRRRQPQ